MTSRPAGGRRTPTETIKEDRPMPLLEVTGLEKWYGRRQVVNGVDFDVDRGEVVGLLGPNGAGKTTSFRMTIGLIDADGGKVLFDGRDVTRLPMYEHARAGMGATSAQEIRASSSGGHGMSVEDNLMAILENSQGHVRRKQRKEPPGRAARPVRPPEDPQDESEPGLGRRAQAARDRAQPDHRAQADSARRAVRRHRPEDCRRDPGPDPRPGRPVQYRHPADRPPVPRDARGDRPLLPDPRGSRFRLRQS